MRALLRDLGDPQEAYPAIHVVGTNGKSTTTRMTAALLQAAGLAVGAYTSPHASDWSERIQVRGEEADFERALERVRRAAEAREATQFEAITAAALAEFAAAAVDAAVVEAGLGGRYDATNVLDGRVVVLTNVALEHTDVLGDTRDAIAREKLAVVGEGAAVVLGEPEWEPLARAAGAARVDVTARSNLALAVAAAEAFLGGPVDPAAAHDVRLPGRLERRGESPLEIWDGAHTPDGLGWLLPRLPRASYVVVASFLDDKDASGMLAALAAISDTLIATASSHTRALPAAEVASRARPRFASVEAYDAPAAALARAREVATADGAVLVTGSLYLIADLHRHEQGVR
jgi:dihydrofolate synthase/folylpolyglutamate synthase